MKTRNFCWMKDWKPRLCRTIQEIHSVLEENGIFNKKIKSFRAIGMARNLDFYQNLLRGGFKKEKILSGRISHFKDSFFPVEAELCEPFFIVFEDNSTLEIMPCNTEHGLLVGTNQIPHNTKDGLNHSNFRPQKFFKEKFVKKALETIINGSISITVISDFSFVGEQKRRKI